MIAYVCFQFLVYRLLLKGYFCNTRTQEQWKDSQSALAVGTHNGTSFLCLTFVLIFKHLLLGTISDVEIYEVME